MGMSTPVSQYTTVTVGRQLSDMLANARYVSFSSADESFPPLNPRNQRPFRLLNSSWINDTVEAFIPSMSGRYGGDFAVDLSANFFCVVSCNSVELLIREPQMVF